MELAIGRNKDEHSEVVLSATDGSYRCRPTQALVLSSRAKVPTEPGSLHRGRGNPNTQDPLFDGGTAEAMEVVVSAREDGSWATAW
mmetsp:Transcript_8920/g.25699  ORF Transcript_8920/g.25699 Transcript_8920/m.25699 type:complete len:86 (-) Transcript_8920:548-805(-)|eukprot:CAMPEP_0117696614 /NCGR_PEP_ID=MMETSP0804-20121206/28773_1 /TAXON_ID=1074897 /ORGANISM="Tetraselmis astigmatica, Strain CCMP880" /LENGTH=85 /DNA_ID=CAMNT_0005510777 /DNA_START=129 /DNA_END=386 /DNA_ORIENTATION=-